MQPILEPERRCSSPCLAWRAVLKPQIALPPRAQAPCCVQVNCGEELALCVGSLTRADLFSLPPLDGCRPIAAPTPVPHNGFHRARMFVAAYGFKAEVLLFFCSCFRRRYCSCSRRHDNSFAYAFRLRVGGLEIAGVVSPSPHTRTFPKKQTSHTRRYRAMTGMCVCKSHIHKTKTQQQPP